METSFYRSLLPIFKISFFIPLFGDGGKKFQPVSIEDIVNSYQRLLNSQYCKMKDYLNLVGPDVFTI